MAYYVDISDVPLDFLEFMGYRVEAESEQFLLLNNKGEQHIVLREGRRFLYVHDFNDAQIFEGRAIIEAPADDDAGE